MNNTKTLLKKIINSIKSSIGRKKLRHDYKNSFKNKFNIKSFYSSDYYKNSDIDLISITFNAPKLVYYQIMFFKKFLQGNCRHIICDNSTKKDAAEKIRKLCEENDITYIRVQDRKIPYGYSNSHAIALNWVWNNVVRERKNNFAFLDHDMFLIKALNPNDYIKNNPCFGKYEIRPSLWYLWAGFSFFNFKCVKNLPLNFHRHKKFGFISLKGKNWVDTGSNNWRCFYSKIDRNRLKPFSEEFTDILTDENLNNLEGRNFVNYLDNRRWLHIFDGGNRQNTETERLKIIYSFLDKLLEE